jgi:hypothetical protein
VLYVLVYSFFAGIGQTCVVSSDCVPKDLAICVRKVCECINGYVPNETGCVPGKLTLLLCVSRSPEVFFD